MTRLPGKTAEAKLKRRALAYPEAVEDFPWEERVFKVRGKIFLFLSTDAENLYVTAKLPDTCGIATLLPNVEPTGYNLGRSGWVSGTFPLGEAPSLKMLEAWLDESYRAVAPKRLVARLPSLESKRR